MPDLSVPTAMLGAALGSAMLAGVLAYLGSRPQASPALRWWAAAFACSLLRHVIGIVANDPVAMVDDFVGDLLLASFIVLLLTGTMLFLGRRPRPAWLVAGFALAAAWSGFASLVVADFQLRAIPLCGAMAAALLWMGSAFWRAGRDELRHEHAFVAAALIVQGLHALDYPYLSTIAAAAPLGYMVAQALWMAIALGFIIIALRRQEALAAALGAESRRAQSLLIDSERRMRDFAEASSDWFWEQDAELRYVAFAGQVASRLPVPVDLVLGRRRDDFRIPEDDAEAWRRHLDDLAQHRPFRDFRMLHKLATGELVHLSISGRPIFDDAGRFKGYRGSGRVITQEVEREQRALQQAKLLQDLIDNVPVGISFVDSKLNAAAFNRHFLDLLEFPSALFKPGDPFEAFIRYNAARGEYGPGDAEQQVRARLALAAQPRAHRFDRVRPDGRIVEIIGSPLPDGGFVTAYMDVTEQRQAESRVRESEERFKDFAEATSDWFWEQDAELRFTYVSPSVNDVSGMSPEDYVGKTRIETQPIGLSEEQGRHHLDDLSARRPFRDLRFQRVDPQGRLRHLSISGKPRFDEAGAFLGYRGTGRDITAEVEAEARANLAQARLASAIDSLSDGLAIFDAEDRLVICNAAYRQTLGPVGERAVPGVRFAELTQAALEAGILELSEKERAGWPARRLGAHRAPRRPLELRLSSGPWIQVRDQRLADGGIAVIITDISEVKERERQLAEKTALLEATLDSMGEGISVFDRDMQLVAWNDKATELLNLPRDFYKPGTTFVDILRFQARRGELSTMSAANGTPPFSDEVVEAEVRRYLENLRENRSWHAARWRSSGRYVEMRRSPMPDGGMVNVFSDMTDRQRVEDALRHAKEAAETANRTKTEFLANMSHELRTPLNAVIGFSEILEQELLGPIGVPRYREYARDIRDSGTHLLTLINDILDVSKAEAGRIELNETIMQVDSVINASLRLINERAREADLTLLMPKTDHLPALKADERRLKQVLINLLSNAVKFTPAGGKVSIDVEADALHGFKIRVADTGIGMAPDDIPKALEPFGQIDSALARKYEGTGLGLPLSKALVELHGGQLAIESEVGVGTTVTVALPPERVVDKAA